MEQQQELHTLLVLWRGQKFVVEMNPSASLKEFGEKLQEITNVKTDTLRLLVPMEKSSKLLYPFSDEHSFLSLDSTSIHKLKSIRMMGVPEDEIDEVLQNGKANHRMAGFDDEEKRLKQRNAHGFHALPKLPQGNHIFCEFRTLSLPGVELNPPVYKALELMHKLASDPGIVAIMNKHRWRVGLLSEMAPIGYVGVSPKCILGLNKNHGEEISLRLRTDDLKGFRKYASIKKTLLHELAHMVFAEHDSNFYALDKQLNEEAATLDWTKSKGHTLSGFRGSQHDEEFDISSNITSHKLGGSVSSLPDARAASVIAAFERLANSSVNLSRSSEEINDLPATDVTYNQNSSEPDPDDSDGGKSKVLEPHVESEESYVNMDIDSHRKEDPLPAAEAEIFKQSITDDLAANPVKPHPDQEVQRDAPFSKAELDDSEEDPNHPRFQKAVQPNPMDSLMPASTEICLADEQHPSNSHAEEMQTEPTVEPDPELQIIQDPVTLFCSRLQSAIQSLKHEVKPSDAQTVHQTLIKIIRNVIERPGEMKFKKLRKANPMIQRNIISYRAAMGILALIGFCEEVIVDEWGNADSFLMLKRNDPGLLWLAKSTLEVHIL